MRVMTLLLYAPRRCVRRMFRESLWTVWVRGDTARHCSVSDTTVVYSTVRRRSFTPVETWKPFSTCIVVTWLTVNQVTVQCCRRLSQICLTFTDIYYTSSVTCQQCQQVWRHTDTSISSWLTTDSWSLSDSQTPARYRHNTTTLSRSRHNTTPHDWLLVSTLCAVVTPARSRQHSTRCRHYTTPVSSPGSCAREGGTKLRENYMKIICQTSHYLTS